MGLIQVPLLGCAVIRHLQKSAGLTLEEDIFILELHFTETQVKLNGVQLNKKCKYS